MAWPQLSTSRKLYLGTNDFTNAGLEALAATPALAGLELLELAQTPCSRAIESVARSPLADVELVTTLRFDDWWPRDPA
jgi:hypothetical protein